MKSPGVEEGHSGLILLHVLPPCACTKHTGILRKAATIRKARACPNCGYVELYLDPNELKKNIS
jgi:hypothetical protein